MINILFKAVRKVVIAIFMLYGLNLIIASLNIVIPINLITISLITLLGLPGLCTLVIMFFVI